MTAMTLLGARSGKVTFGLVALLVAMSLAAAQETPSSLGQKESTARAADFAKKLAKSIEAKRLLEEARQRISVEEALEQIEAVRDAETTGYFDFCLERVTKKVADSLARFPNLTSLNLRCDAIDADAAPAFAKMKKLTGLHVTGQVTDEFAAAIAALPHLQQLSLNPEKLSPRGGESLAKAPRLSVLSVTGAVRGGEFFSTLGAKAKIASLAIWNCKIDEKAVKSLSSLKQLHALTIDEQSEIEGDVVAAIADVPSLSRVWIRQGKSSLSAAQLKTLARMPLLADLDLANTILDDLQLLEFRKAERLTGIKFRGQVSLAAIESFLRTQPKGCEVVQLTTEEVALEGWTYRIKDEQFAFQRWPVVIEVLRAE